ncbi:MAG: bifunctional phosphoserine phosphatase/homoserine phosphotransferase ThrH, partial [Candidatus Saccharimonadales bacterium]|nr:bifunctional phosphoserine phosphatase/homoserine phosphotransferase ThrH [Candidatus Saccharimonadales bacterium]
MELMCLDFESVLVPEVWLAIAKHFGIKELEVTTKDFSDYNELMEHRIKVLNEHKIKAADLFEIANQLSPLPGAEEFLQWLRERGQVIILSDTYYEFITPLQKKLNYPAIFAHRFIVDENGFI